MRAKRARRPRRWLRGTRMASGVTDVVRDRATGRLAVDEVCSGVEEELSDDVEALDGAIDISSSFLCGLCSIIWSFSDMLLLSLRPKPFFFVVSSNGGPVEWLASTVPGSSGGFSGSVIV